MLVRTGATNSSYSNTQIHLGPCLAEGSHQQSKYSSDLMLQFSCCFVPCFLSGEGSSLFLSHRGITPSSNSCHWLWDLKVSSWKHTVCSIEVTGSDDSGNWGSQVSEHRDVFFTGLSTATSSDVPYHATIHLPAQPFAHHQGPAGAASLPFLVNRRTSSPSPICSAKSHSGS